MFSLSDGIASDVIIYFWLLNLVIVTASDIHRKMQQLCTEHTVCPPIKVQHLAEQLSLDKQALTPHIDSLATLGLVEYQDDNKEVVLLTTSGKLARLP
jgi:DNA-binding MarR family transcriptional regulator